MRRTRHRAPEPWLTVGLVSVGMVEVMDGGEMPEDPLQRILAFWRPLIGRAESAKLSAYREPDQELVSGINVVRSDYEPAYYRVLEGEDEYSLYAAVHPIAEVPDGAEVLAQIRQRDGSPHSYVLWFPHEEAVLVPFDPSAAVRAFQLEEYVSASRRTLVPAGLLPIYYKVARPLMPPALRCAVRKRDISRALDRPDALRWPSDLSQDRLQRLMLRAILLVSRRQQLPFVWLWPDRHPWAATLTHDVETSRGLEGVSRVVDVERSKGLRSSFNFVPLDYEVPATMLSSLREEGFEIGVHGYTHDGLMFSSWSRFVRRVKVVNEFGRQWKASGFRSPATYRNLAWFRMLGFEYDSSVSNSAPLEPQPGGCASFFPYLVDDIVELPTTLPQDHTLFGLFERPDASVWLGALDTAAELHGMACVLTHPDPEVGYLGAPGNIEHYTTLLDAVRESGAWTPLPRELARWWRARATTAMEHIEGLDGMAFGVATLDEAGGLQLVPPQPATEAQSAAAARHRQEDAPVVPPWRDLADAEMGSGDWRRSASST